MRLLALLLAACTSGPPATAPLGQAILDLGGAFTQQPWLSSRGATGPMRLQGRFLLPEDRVGAGSVLELEGLWWQAQVTLNGVEFPPVTGGNSTARLPVGAALKSGENELLIVISPPTTESPIETGGGLSSSGFPAAQPTLQTAPRLLLRPAVHVDWVAVPAEGGQARPQAQVTGAPAGASVRFSVWEGATERPLGSAAVGATGRAVAPPVAWPLDWWAPAQPALYTVSAVLEAGGRPLDRLDARTGLRSVAVGEAGLEINGQPHRLVGARVTNRPDLGELPARFAALMPAGVNALEIHGELPRSSWLNLADEVGLPVVLLPRCVGRTRRGSTATPATFAQQEDQDRRFLVDLLDHPGVLLWVGEGPSAKTQRGQAVPLATWTPVLLEDPLQRPIVQEQLPDRFLQVQPPGPDGIVHHSCQREPCAGAWLVEVTWEGPTVPAMWPAMATAFSEAMAAGAVGGVVPTPERHDQGTWLSVFAPLTEALEAPPLTAGPFRAPAAVALTGGSPGETAWVMAPGAGTVGAVISADGSAAMNLWAEGAAQVELGGRVLPLDLLPRRWLGLEIQGEPTRVQAQNERFTPR